MAKINIERAYIEPYDEDDWSILFHVKQGNDKGQIDHIFVGKVDMDRLVPWTYMEDQENGDLWITYSKGREVHWNHIIGDILHD